jgi:cyclopropane-fatty-acyl-phospholipid synthase
MAQATVTEDRRAAQVRAVLERLLEAIRPREFAVRLWTGETINPEPGCPARFTLVLNHPGALGRMLWPPSDLTIGEAYIRGDFDIEGDLIAAFSLREHFTRPPFSLREGLRLVRVVRRAARTAPPTQPGREPARLRGARHSKERDQAAVRYHYDVGNDFYALWLDRNMVYSCAYFETGTEDIDTAQEAKLDYICRKLRLKPGERLLDIGCGWGGLLIHAAERYGVEAVGITLSPPQAEWARERIEELGLSDRCRVEVADYRDFDEGPFDKLVSVGMFEHVGAKMLPVYFKKAWSLLRPGGVFLNHGITLGPGPRDEPSWWGRTLFKQGEFIQRYVFPDGELEPIHESLQAASEVGFELRDLESLREHYALTLRHWVRRLEAHHDEVVRVAGEAVYRIWRLFMAGSAYHFEIGRLNVYQALFVKPDRGRSGLPLTRADWYAPYHEIDRGERKRRTKEVKTR